MKKEKLSEQVIKEIIDTVKATKSAAKTELPKVASDLLKEGVINNAMVALTSALFLLHVALPIYLFNTVPEVQDRWSGPEAPAWVQMYLFFSSAASAVSLLTLISSINNILVVKHAPRAFLLNKLLNSLKQDEK